MWAFDIWVAEAFNAVRQNKWFVFFRHSGSEFEHSDTGEGHLLAFLPLFSELLI